MVDEKLHAVKSPFLSSEKIAQKFPDKLYTLASLQKAFNENSA